MLVQREMENWRSPLASIPPSSAGQLGEHRPTQWRTVERAAAETATGFKKEIRLVVPHSHKGGRALALAAYRLGKKQRLILQWGKTNRLRKGSRIHAGSGI